jgi:tripartite-type tricarboxylate transporter receptor subunit TctC
MATKRQVLQQLGALCITAYLPSLAKAQPGWPRYPVKIVLPYTAGGATDKLARMVAQAISPQLQQPVVVDNRPGGTGALGSALVANSQADGYTLLVGFVGSMVLMPLLNTKLGYDVQRDFAPVSRLATYDFVIVATPAFPARDMKAIVALEKSRGNSVAYGTTGIGSPLHLVMEQYRRSAHADFRHIPYKGEQPMVTDLLGGHLELGLLTPATAEPLIQSGKLRAVAVTARQRSPKLPNVPTFAESGYPEASFEAWAGLLAARATPPAVLDRLNTVVVEALMIPKLQAELLAAGFTAAPTTRDGFAQLIKDDLVRYAGLINAAGLKAE